MILAEGDTLWQTQHRTFTLAPRTGRPRGRKNLGLFRRA